MSKMPWVAAKVMQARGQGPFAPGEGGTPEPPPPQPIGDMSLVGDPAFDDGNLSSAQRARMNTVKALIDDREGGSYDPWSSAGRGSIWWYSHSLASHVFAQSVLFRATGDLYFLDTWHEFCEDMMADLVWSNYDTGSDYFWRWMRPEYDPAPDDRRIDYDVRAHSLSLFMAYALHLNRGLTSPTGKNYGAMADQVLAYHVNEFEPKLRRKWGTTNGSWPMVPGKPTQNIAHCDWGRWHYYMYLWTGNTDYLDEAERISDVFLGGLETCPDTVTARGTAYVHLRDWIEDYGDYLMPFAYQEFAYQVIMDFHFQGFRDWADPIHLQRFALQMSELAWEGPNWDDWHIDVGGDVARCGIPDAASSTSQDLAAAAVNAFRYQNGCWGMMAAYDPEPSPIPAWNASARTWAEGQGHDYARIVAAEFLYAYLHGG